MKSMQDKYYNDPQYRQCVDLMVSLIYDNKFTPSEMREMAVMASVIYEQTRAGRYVLLDPETEYALKILRDKATEK